MNRNQLIAAGACALLAILAWLSPRFGGDSGQHEQDGVVYDSAGIVVGGIEPNPGGGTPLNIDNILANQDKTMVISRDGADTFTVPGPEDPEWADYLEYRRHNRTFMDNTDGFVIAYDPEWRSTVTGVRENPTDPGLELFGGRSSLRELVEEVVANTTDVDNQQALIDLALRKEEFEVICWPSFPQSRPYVRIPWEEAWGFHYANLVGGSREGIRQVDGRSLEVVDVTFGSVKDYNGHFRVHNGGRIHAIDSETGENVELTYLDSIIERNGEFKVFLYKD